MTNKITGLCCLTLVTMTCVSIPSVYLSEIKNGTPSTLYKIIVPDEDYDILLPAGKSKYLGAWFDLRRGNELQLAVMQGDGEPVFIHIGPESAGCGKEDVACSIIYWTSAPSVDSNEKVYQTFCQTDDQLRLVLSIEPDGTPVVSELKD